LATVSQTVCYTLRSHILSLHALTSGRIIRAYTLLPDLYYQAARCYVQILERSFTALSGDTGNSDCSFGRGLQTPNLGEEEEVGGRVWYGSKEHW